MNNFNNKNSMKKIFGGIMAVGLLGVATQIIFAEETTTLSGTNTLLTATGAVPSDITAPVISNVHTEGITASTVQIKWTTDEPSDSTGMYNTASVATSFYVKNRCDGGGNVLQHCAYLTELYPGSKYYYKIASRNSAGLTSYAYGDFLTILQSGTTTSVPPVTTSTQTGTIVPAPTPVLAPAPTTVVAPLPPVIDQKETSVSNEPTPETAKPAESTMMHNIQPSLGYPIPSAHAPTPAEVAQKSEPVKSKISIKNAGNVVDGEEVHVKVNQAVSGVEMRLSRKESKESFYLGQAQYDPIKTEWVFKWDSTQTPDGAYTITPVIKAGSEAVVQGDVKTVMVKNEKGSEVNNSSTSERATQRASEATSGGTRKPDTHATGVVPERAVPALGATPAPVALVTPEKFIEKIKKEKQQEEERIKNDIASALVSPDMAKREATSPVVSQSADQHAVQAETVKKIEELKVAISEGDIEKKKAIVAEMVNAATASSGGVASEAVRKNVEEKVAKLEQVAEEQKVGVVDTENFSVDALRVAEVATKPDGTQSASKIEFRGKAIPNSFATLYIYSIPIVVTIKTDKDGYWNYTLDKELENGKHQVYVAITDVKGAVVAKSSPLPFIKEASAVTLDQINTAPVQQDSPSFVGDNYFYGSILAIALIIIAIFVLLGIKMKDTPQP